MRCTSYCTASSYQTTALVTYLKEHHTNLKLYRDIIYCKLADADGEVFYFPQGCIVCWGLGDEQEQHVIQQLKNFEKKPLNPAPKEVFNYQIGGAASFQISQDLIVLEKDSPLIKLAISYGLAQSIKLIIFEDTIDKTINETSYIPQILATKGKIPLTRKEIARQMGKLFITRSSINLNSDFLDTPEFFWENPTLETYYKIVANYLDIEKRVDVLNRRLDVIHELFGMLTNELQHQHSSVLELIIIYLITIEILIVIFKDLLGWI